MGNHRTLLAVSSLYEFDGLELKKIIELAKNKRKDYILRKRKLLNSLHQKTSLSNPKDFFALNDDGRRHENTFDIFDYDEHYQIPLPQYCLDKNGHAIEYDGFLDFDDKNNYTSDKKYYFFDLSTNDPILQEEINNIGICDIIENDDLRVYFEKFKKLTYYDLSHRAITTCQYLIIGISYWTDYWGESDAEMGVTGYLDDNLQACYEFKEAEKKADEEYWEKIAQDMMEEEYCEKIEHETNDLKTDPVSNL